MATATVTQMPFGYVVTGDTDATPIYTGKKKIKMMAFSGNADNATAALTCTASDERTDISCMKFKSSDTNELNSASGNYIWFGENGSEFKNLKVTLSNGGDHLYVHVA